MQLISTPTLPADIPARAMLDIESLPAEYAVHIDTLAGLPGLGVVLVLGYQGQSVLLPVDDDELVSVVSYAAPGTTTSSNVLESAGGVL